jgi:hypothetical protein
METKFMLQIREFTNEETYEISLYENGRFVSDGYTALVDARNRAKEGAEVNFRYALSEIENNRETELKVKKGKVNADGKLLFDDETELKLEEARKTKKKRNKPSYSHLLEIKIDEKGDMTGELFTYPKDDKPKEKVEIPEDSNSIDYAFDIASHGGKILYEITNADGSIERGKINKEGAMVGQPVRESVNQILGLIGKQTAPKQEMNESVGVNDVNFDWYLELPTEKGFDNAILYADEREDSFEGDRQPKHREFEGKSAIRKAKDLAKAEAEGKSVGGIAFQVGRGNRKKDGFLKFKNGKFVLERDKKEDIEILN